MRKKRSRYRLVLEIKAKTTRNPSPAATYILEGFEKSGGITGEGDGHIQCSFCKNFVEAGFQVPEILVKGVEVAKKAVNKTNDTEGE